MFDCTALLGFDADAIFRAAGRKVIEEKCMSSMGSIIFHMPDLLVTIFRPWIVQLLKKWVLRHMRHFARTYDAYLKLNPCLDPFDDFCWVHVIVYQLGSLILGSRHSRRRMGLVSETAQYLCNLRLLGGQTYPGTSCSFIMGRTTSRY